MFRNDDGSVWFPRLDLSCQGAVFVAEIRDTFRFLKAYTCPIMVIRGKRREEVFPAFKTVDIPA